MHNLKRSILTISPARYGLATDKCEGPEEIALPGTPEETHCSTSVRGILLAAKKVPLVNMFDIEYDSNAELVAGRG